MRRHHAISTLFHFVHVTLPSLPGLRGEFRRAILLPHGVSIGYSDSVRKRTYDEAGVQETKAEDF